jgi:ATP-binding cassette, subfamily C (CFTR/MRP), member 1
MARLVNRSDDSHFGPAYSGPARNFDFTILFEDTILTILPAAIFLLGAIARSVWLVNSPNKVVSSLSRSSKLCFLSAFTAIQLAVLVVRATHLEIATTASVAAAALDFSAACVLFVLSWFEHSRSVAPSTIIGLYLLLSLVFDGVRLRTFYLTSGYGAQAVAHMMSLSVAAKVGVLITETVEKRSILLPAYKDLPPEQTSGIYNKSFFWWVNPLLMLGFRSNFHTDDLFTLDQKLGASYVQPIFKRKWQAKRSHGPNSLMWMTADILKWSILLSATPRVALSGARFAQPFLVQATLEYVSDRTDQQASTGWGLAAAYFLDYCAMAVFSTSYRHLTNRALVQLRSGLIGLLYDKTLALSITATDTTAAMSLMSTDINRLVDALQMFHDLWGGLLDLGLAMFLLYLRLGSACYAPAIVYILQLTATSALVKVSLPSPLRGIRGPN